MPKLLCFLGAFMKDQGKSICKEQGMFPQAMPEVEVALGLC